MFTPVAFSLFSYNLYLLYYNYNVVNLLMHFLVIYILYVVCVCAESWERDSYTVQLYSPFFTVETKG